MEKTGSLVDTGVSRADEANNAIALIGKNAQMAEESSAAAGQTAESARLLDTLVQRQSMTLAAFRV